MELLLLELELEEEEEEEEEEEDDDTEPVGDVGVFGAVTGGSNVGGGAAGGDCREVVLSTETRAPPAVPLEL